MGDEAGIGEPPDDLARIVDAEGLGTMDPQGSVQRGEAAAAATQEAVKSAGVAVFPDDLRRVVDAECNSSSGGGGGGIIERGEGPGTATQEAVGLGAGVGKRPDDL